MHIGFASQMSFYILTSRFLKNQEILVEMPQLLLTY